MSEFILGAEVRRQAESLDFCQQVIAEALAGLDSFELRSEKQLDRLPWSGDV